MRKVLISILVCLLLIGSAFFMVNGISAVNIKGIKGLDEKNSEVEQKISELSNIISVTYTNTESNLKRTSNDLQEVKTEYETQAMLSSNNNSSYAAELDPYEIDYLWTKLGNYAKEENVIIKIELVADGAKVEVAKGDGTKTTRTLCTLNFTVNGDYVNITDFIYDIENDSRLGFKIDSFKMTSSADSPVVATFSCTDIPVTVGTIDAAGTNASTQAEGTTTGGASNTQAESKSSGETTKTQNGANNTAVNNTTSNTTDTATNTNL